METIINLNTESHSAPHLISMKTAFSTSDRFTMEQLRLLPGATGESNGLSRDNRIAAKRINVEVDQAGLREMSGDMGFRNIQGEEVKKPNVYASNEFIHVLKNRMSCGGVCSEEENDIIVFDDAPSHKSKNVVLCDPLDGSGNIATNISSRTICSIYRRVTSGGKPCSTEDFLQAGPKQAGAGFIIYGSPSMQMQT